MSSQVAALLLLLLTSAGLLGAPASRGQDGAARVTVTPITVGEKLLVNSKRLGEGREIEVYLPAGYANSRQHYPVVYALDGEGTGPAAASAVRFMTNYAAVPHMPEAIVVAVVNTDRNRDMPVPQDYGRGGEDNFLAFLSEELVPLIEQRYRTQPLRILVGHSQGGLFAHYALSARPAVFQWYLSLDAPLAGVPETRTLMGKVRAVITKTPNYRGRLVSVERLYGWRKEWPSLVAGAPRGFYGAQFEILDESHETMAYRGIYEGLKRLFHDYTPDLAEDDKGIYTLAALDETYKEVSAAYGYQVDIPRQVLTTVAARNTAMRYGAEAVELVKRAEALYGQTSMTKRLLAEAEDAVRRGRDTRLAEWAALPPPAPGRMSPYLGVWESVTHDGARLSVTFEVKDGVVRAQNSVTPPGGESFQREVQFVRVLDGQTLQWGVRNGRGAGIILHTGKLVDENTLQGTVEPVGIEFAPPPHPFTYRRRSGDKPK
jgi:pimeloyl-ACP methyl ester carboxylesterase